MIIKKKDLKWPSTYEAPRVYNIDTAYQQALGVTACIGGYGAVGTGACSVGTVAVGKQSCSFGWEARPKHAGHACDIGFKPGEGTK